MTPVVQFNHISKKYQLGMTRTSIPTILHQFAKKTLRRNKSTESIDDSIWALQDVSFELQQGESMALVGSNGAGKTTILKLLAKITKPTSGSFETKGKLSALIELGSGFHPDLSGRDNIYLNGTLLGLNKSEIKKRFDEIVAFSELERFIDTPLKRYSSGMAVRLGFAVAASIDPDILLVDEILAVGDAAFRQKCMQRIHKLLDVGSSIIFVSHNLWLVQAVCQKGLLLDKGQVILSGPINDVIDLYDRRLNEQRATRFEKERSFENPSSEEIQITKVDIYGEMDHDRDGLRNDKSAQIHVAYIAYQRIEAVNVVVRILRSDGLTCCAMRTKLDNIKLAIEPGVGSISVTLDPLQLYGGTYYIQAIFRDNSDAETITTGWSNWFYVAGSVLSHQEMNGVYEPNRSWEHHPVSNDVAVEQGRFRL